jgi:hypothetical protein
MADSSDLSGERVEFGPAINANVEIVQEFVIPDDQFAE